MINNLKRFEKIYNGTCMCGTDTLKCLDYQCVLIFLEITINTLIEDTGALIETQLF